MSLDIIAFDPIETEKRKDKFEEKYNVPFEKFENDMFIPSKDDFFYYLHPQWLENDTKVYKEMRKAAEKIQNFAEIDSFHIGYGHFHFLRKELGELIGVVYNDEDIFNSTITYDNKLTSTPLLSFFFHSDCDGIFTADDVQNSYKQFTNICDKNELQDKRSGNWGEEISGFLNFWQKSAEQKLQWEFC